MRRSRWPLVKAPNILAKLARDALTENTFKVGAPLERLVILLPGGLKMKKKFKIMHPNGKPYLPPHKKMVVMNGQGVFFLYSGEEYYPYIQELSKVLPKYDVVWK